MKLIKISDINNLSIILIIGFCVFIESNFLKFILCALVVSKFEIKEKGRNCDRSILYIKTIKLFIYLK